MKRSCVYFILLLFILPAYSLAQKSCIDSFENKSWYNSQFKYMISLWPPISYDDSSVLYNGQGIFIKKDKQENILWTKQLLSGVGYQYLIPEFINSKQQTILSFATGPTPIDQGLVQLGSDGNLIHAKKITFNIQVGGGHFSVDQGPGDGVILCNHTGSNGQLLIALLDSNVSQKWGKTFNLQLNKNENLTSVRIACFNESVYVIAKSEIVKNVNKVYSDFLLIMKIDAYDGNLLIKKNIS